MHTHSRRGFLARTLGASFAGASLLEQASLRAAQARAQANPSMPALFDLEKVADGVYAAIAKPSAIGNCNAAIFENANDLLIVDAHSKGSAVTALVAQLRRDFTQKPIRYIVNTHMHWDHVQGDSAYKRIAPTADIVSSETTRKLMAELSAPRFKEQIESAGKAVETNRAKASSAKTAEEKAYYEKLAGETQSFLTEMQGYTQELPNVTFNENLILHDKAHDLHLAFRGRGHTAGDIVVFCPQKKALAGGDLLHGSFPYVDDGYPREWGPTLRSVDGFAYTRAIGGHGGVVGKERAGQMAAYMDELVEIAAKAKREGRSVEEMQRSVNPASLKSIQNGGYGDAVVAGILANASGPSRPAPAQILENAVRRNLAGVYNTLDKT